MSWQEYLIIDFLLESERSDEECYAYNHIKILPKFQNI